MGLRPGEGCDGAFAAETECGVLALFGGHKMYKKLVIAFFLIIFRGVMQFPKTFLSYRQTGPWSSIVTARFSLFCSAYCVGSLAFLASSVRANDGIEVSEPSTLVAVTAQDEPRKLPKDITAVLSRADRRVRFELVKLAGKENQSLAGMSVTVIDPNGKTEQIKADASGIAVLNNAKPGLHAVVIGGAQGHGAIPVALREAPEAEENAAGVPATFKLPLVDVEPREVFSLAKSSQPSSGASDYNDIDGDFVSTGAVSDGFGYRIRLSESGALTGQVLSLVKSGISSAGVEGTNIMIYRGSKIAAETVADQGGFFRIENLPPGVYGLVAVGPSGYAAFGFDAYSAKTIAQSVSNSEVTLVSTSKLAPGDGDLLPVVLVPTPMVAQLVNSLQQSYGSLLGPAGGLGGLAGLAPGLGAAGFGGAAGGTGAAGGAGGAAGGAGAAGGFGGIGGLAAIAGVGAAAAAVGANSGNNSPGTPASQSHR